jgi:hypothetical protein
MRVPLRRPALAALLAMTTVAGCSLTGPDRDEGEYVLVSLKGTPVPTVTTELPSLLVIVVADTIVLRDDGTGVRTSVSDSYEMIDGVPSGAEPNRVRSSTSITWSTVLGLFEAAFVCPPNANCIAGPHIIGRFSDDGLVLERDLGRQGPARYRRRF